ncbi:MAG: SAM-dependent methyltransferase [SAR202 cluster bacterium]|nr:SAM-dependent methyltransferase [SAR202 cluster bacterium]
MTATMTPEAEICRRIQSQGAITLAEFMDVALFWPRGGYYLSRNPIGPSGDYYTSPLVHPAFGALLAVQLYQMWLLLDRPNPFTVAEPGAGGGQLCRDILAAAQQLPAAFGRSLRYVCLDRRMDNGQDSVLINVQGFPSVTRLTSDGIPLRHLKGCILSNELLDAFPVHQVTCQQGKLRENYVTLQGDALAIIAGEPSTSRLATRLSELGIALAEGQIAEINLGLEDWASQGAAALDAGFVLTIDYGHPAQELYSAERRPRGTLVTYYQHVQTDAPLRRIGHQDITAQVDFTSVVNAGRRAGLQPLGFTTQGQFLENLGLGDFQRRLASLGLPRQELRASQAGLAALAGPGGLGGFKALVQGKNVGQPELWGFTPADTARELVEDLPVPMLTPRHLRLAGGGWTQAA